MNDEKWEKVSENYVTPGGDPIYRCPKCHDPKSWHVFGIEHTQNHMDECPACKTKLTYF